MFDDDRRKLKEIREKQDLLKFYRTFQFSSIIFLILEK